MGKFRQSLFGLAFLSMSASGALTGCADGGDEDTLEESALNESQSALWGRRCRGRHSRIRSRWCDRYGPDAGKQQGSNKDIVETAVANGNFTILAKALAATDLVATLQSSGPFTVFAPTDAAFEALGQATLDALSTEELATILKYHVIAGELPSTALKAGPVSTASGLTAFVSLNGGVVKVNDATVTTADVDASNGVIHVIDKVLLPPNLVQAATYAGSFSTLLGAATTAGLADELSAPDADLTLFAPPDEAFAAIASIVAGLSTDELADVLKYHLVAGKVLAKDLSEGTVSTLLGGKDLTVSLDGGVTINDVDVVLTDIVTTNGIIHVVSEVLIPPA